MSDLVKDVREGVLNTLSIEAEVTFENNRLRVAYQVGGNHVMSFPRSVLPAGLWPELRDMFSDDVYTHLLRMFLEIDVLPRISHQVRLSKKREAQS